MISPLSVRFFFKNGGKAKIIVTQSTLQKSTCAINCSLEESYTTGLQASCPSQVTHAESCLKALACYPPCLKSQRIMGMDRPDSAAFYNRGMWSRPLVRLTFTVFYFRASHGLVRHILQVLITMTSVPLPTFFFCFCCFNHTTPSHHELDLTRRL